MAHHCVFSASRRRWWTLVHEMDNTLELGDTVQGSMMLEHSRFEQNMVLTCTKGQRTMTAIAEALLQQHYDVHHRGRETPTPTGNSSPPNRWRRRDTTRACLAVAEPIKELTDTAAYGEEGISDDYDGEQNETKTTKSMRRISPLCWITRAKTQRRTTRWQKLCSWTR